MNFHKVLSNFWEGENLLGMELQMESGQLPSHCSCFPWARGAALATQEGLFIPWTGCGTAAVWCSSCIRWAPAPVDFAFPSSSAPLSRPGLCWEGEGNFGKQRDKALLLSSCWGFPCCSWRSAGKRALPSVSSTAFKNTEAGCFRDK